MEKNKKMGWSIVMTFIVYVIIVVSSCNNDASSETGGTVTVAVAVSNSYYYSCTVYIADGAYNPVSGSVQVSTGNPRDFIIKDDGKYWVVIDASQYKSVSLTGGNKVRVEIP